MGAVNSRQADIPGNILNEIKNKDYSVISINENSNTFHNKGNIMVTKLNGDGTCHPLPESSILKPGDKLNKNIFVTGNKNTGKKYVRLYANDRCTIRANEEGYATLKNPESDLFSPNLNDKSKPDPDTIFTYVPYNEIQNAHYYKINNTEINTPILPQFYIKNKESNTFINKQFPEYEESNPYACREIPTKNPTNDNNELDYNFAPTNTDAKISDLKGREVGIDRFPDENQSKSAPITIYTSRDNDHCYNIYTPSVINSGDKIGDGPHKPPTKSEQVRYTPIPYTKIHGYGKVIAEKSNSLNYQLKNEEGILD
jgi:hypothetical protein